MRFGNVHTTECGLLYFELTQIGNQGREIETGVALSHILRLEWSSLFSDRLPQYTHKYLVTIFRLRQSSLLLPTADSPAHFVITQSVAGIRIRETSLDHSCKGQFAEDFIITAVFWLFFNDLSHLIFGGRHLYRLLMDFSSQPHLFCQIKYRKSRFVNGKPHDRVHRRPVTSVRNSPKLLKCNRNFLE